MALVKFNGLVKKVKKDSDNPFFKSKYAALPDILAAIHEPLIQSGLVINQFPTGNHGLTTILIHAESGEYMMDTYTMTPSKNDPQGIGSCITYQRRYAVGAILSLNIDEDDDGNKASMKPEPKQAYVPKQEVKVLTELTPKDAGKWKDALDYLVNKNGTIEKVKKSYLLSKVNEDLLLEQASQSI